MDFSGYPECKCYGSNVKAWTRQSFTVHKRDFEGVQIALTSNYRLTPQVHQFLGLADTRIYDDSKRRGLPCHVVSSSSVEDWVLASGLRVLRQVSRDECAKIHRKANPSSFIHVHKSPM